MQNNTIPTVEDYKTQFQNIINYNRTENYFNYKSVRGLPISYSRKHMIKLIASSMWYFPQAHQSLRHSKKFLHDAAVANPDILNQYRESFTDINLMIDLVRSYPRIIENIKYVGGWFDNPTFLLRVIKENPDLQRYIDSSMLENLEYKIGLSRINPSNYNYNNDDPIALAFKYLSQSELDNPEKMLKLIEEFGADAFRHVGKKLSTDYGFQAKVIKCVGKSSLRHCPREYKTAALIAALKLEGIELDNKEMKEYGFYNDMT